LSGFKKLPLDEATDAQIRVFAREVLQLEDADSAAIKSVRAKVKDAWAQDYILMAEEPPPVQTIMPPSATPPQPTKAEIEAKAGPGIAASSSKNDPVVDLVIAEQDVAGGKDPVFLNVNNMAIMIARRKPQAVPWRYYLVLKAAKQQIYTQDPDTLVTTSQWVQRFPFQRIENGRFPTEDEIYEWRRADAARSGQEYTREYHDAVREKERNEEYNQAA